MAPNLNQLLERTRRFYRFTGKWAPWWAVRTAAREFLTPFPKSKPTQWTGDLQAKAEALSILYSGESLRGWKWGSGSKILLAHGWGASSEHWGAVIKALLAAGFQVFAFDAPAHGASRKKQTNALDYSLFLAQVKAEYGPFDAAIGHSWGASSLLYALKTGWGLSKAVFIAPFTNSHHNFDQYAQNCGIPDRIKQKAKEKLLKFFGEHRDGWDMAKIVGNVETKVLLFHDEEDMDVPIADSVELAQNLKHSTFIRTQGLGHRKILRNSDVQAQIIAYLNAD